MAILPITIVRGDTLKLRFRFRDSFTQLPVDITDWKLYLTFKPDSTLPDNSASTIQQIYDLSETDSLSLKILDLNAPAGDVTLRLGPEKTKLFFPARKYLWDLQRVQTITESVGPDEILRDHDVTTYVNGTATVTADITLSYLQGTLGEPLP